MLTKELRLCNVLELGVEKEHSTIAFLEASSQVGGHVCSVNLDSCGQAKAPVRNAGLEAYWTFIEGDDLKIDWQRLVDHLFIDTQHIFAQAFAELTKYEPYGSPGGVISLHDSVTFPGLARAAETYFKNREAVTMYEYRNGHGLLII
jgi:cephalosporin hydroxylase